jgi:hypothetical protein
MPGQLPVQHCGKAVRYTMQRDDDQRSVRVYSPFCPEHQKLADQEDAAEDAENKQA